MVNMLAKTQAGWRRLSRAQTWKANDTSPPAAPEAQEDPAQPEAEPAQPNGGLTEPKGSLWRRLSRGKSDEELEEPAEAPGKPEMPQPRPQQEKRKNNGQLVGISSEVVRAVGGRGKQFRGLLASSKAAERRGPFARQATLSLDSNGVVVAKTSVCSVKLELDGGAETRWGEGQVENGAQSRLKHRKGLFARRRQLGDAGFVSAFGGVVLAVFDAELRYQAQSDGADDAFGDWWWSLGLRSLVVLSTALLLGLIGAYHWTEAEIWLLDSGAEDWRVAASAARIRRLVLELGICCITPIPGSGLFQWPYFNADHRSIRWVEMPVDTLLTVLMFLRAYLLPRFIVLHSSQFDDASIRAIAALNRVRVDFFFVVKTTLSQQPLKVFVGFTAAFALCMAWILSLCERHSDSPENWPLLNSLWLVGVTFLSVGYGDVVPRTYCGRAVALATGVAGVAVSAGLVAMMGRAMALGRPEQLVNAFMADSRLRKELQNAAAAVIQATFRIHQRRRKEAGWGGAGLAVAQRRFLATIDRFRGVREEQRRLAESTDTLHRDGEMRLAELGEAVSELRRGQAEILDLLRGGRPQRLPRQISSDM